MFTVRVSHSTLQQPHSTFFAGQRILCVVVVPEKAQLVFVLRNYCCLYVL